MSAAERSEQEGDIREAGIPPSGSPTREEGIRQHRFSAPPGATTVLVVRHAESAAEVPGKPFELRDGHGDPELHPAGFRQADLLADRLQHDKIDAIYVTTLRRTHQTAAPLAARLGITPIEEPDLREVFLGEWEGGLFRERAVAEDPVFMEIFRQERWDVIPGAEPLEEFDARVWGAFQRIVADHPDQTVMVVAHGGVIAHLLHRVSDSRRFAFSVTDNASISEVVASPDRIVLRRYNDVSHLSSMS